MLVRGTFRVGVNRIAGPTGRELHLGMRITLGTISRWLLVFWIIVPGCSRNGSGERPYLWVQEKITHFDRALKMRDSVLQNSWDIFFVTLPSIYSEMVVMYSPVIPGTNVLWDWLLLVCNCVSLKTAANFGLFPNVATSCGKKFTVVETKFSVILFQLEQWQKRGFQMSDKLQSSQLTEKVKRCQCQQWRIIILYVLSFLLFIPFLWRETKLFTRLVKVQEGKST